MISLLSKAIAFAVEAHDGQLDQGGDPHIFHCLRMMLACPRNEMIQAAAMLHDILEDTKRLYAELEALFGSTVAAAVLILTKREDEKGLNGYRRFIQRVLAAPGTSGEIALIIKKLDVLDNSSESRLASCEPKTRDYLRKKYDMAKGLLGI